MSRPARFVLRLASAFAVILVSVLLYNSFRLSSREFTPVRHSPATVDVEALGRQLSALVRIRTVAPQPGTGQVDRTVFQDFHRVLQRLYPKVHEHLEVRTVNRYSLLYTWHGSDSALRPILLLAHMDVVPAPGARRWRQPPFSGRISAQHVWGRGTLDDKGSIAAMFHALEALLDGGYRPARSLIIALGHDEETGGRDGAMHLARVLQERGVRPLFILDEWSPVISRGLLGLRRPVALIGIAEKGYMNVRLSVRAHSGHTSRPPRRTAIGRLARALARVERHPMPADYSHPTRAMLEQLAPQASLLTRLTVANPWLFEQVLLEKLGRSPATNALIRTTAVPTLVHAGSKENVLPAEASALLNVRLLPGVEPDRVLAHLRKVIADSRVTVEIAGRPVRASAVSADDSDSYVGLARIISRVYDNVLVAPTLMIGAADSRHYQRLNAPVYRFRPLQLTMADTRRVHGIDERVSLTSLKQAAQFYSLLFQRFGR